MKVSTWLKTFFLFLHPIGLCIDLCDNWQLCLACVNSLHTCNCLQDIVTEEMFVNKERAMLQLGCNLNDRVPTVREKSVKNEKSSRSGKFQGILIGVREI